MAFAQVVGLAVEYGVGHGRATSPHDQFSDEFLGPRLKIGEPSVSSRAWPSPSGKPFLFRRRPCVVRCPSRPAQKQSAGMPRCLWSAREERRHRSQVSYEHRGAWPPRWPTNSADARKRTRTSGLTVAGRVDIVRPSGALRAGGANPREDGRRSALFRARGGPGGAGARKHKRDAATIGSPLVPLVTPCRTGAPQPAGTPPVSARRGVPTRAAGQLACGLRCAPGRDRSLGRNTSRTRNAGSAAGRRAPRVRTEPRSPA